MDLYQAGYFRLGKQGRGSGWDIIAPSDGMSNFAIEGFKGIATSLIKLEEAMRLPVEVVGLFQHDNFIYFTHVNYTASGKDDRGVAYVHGYCFNLKDYYELCIQPEILFGIKPGTFDMEYRPEIKAYSIEHSLSYEKIDYDKLMDKYHISNEQYTKLVFGVICAIEGYSNPMCIKYSTSLDNYLEIYKDVMYLVMVGLPYHLRQKVLSFSYKGMHTTVYFSAVAEGNNYFDLDRGEVFGDFSILKKYYFTQIYNSPIYYNRDILFKNISEFINNSYKSPFKNANCEMIEAGFQVKNNGYGIPPGIVLDLLDTFLRNDITNSDEAAKYIASLLEIAYDNNLKVTKRVPMEKIKELYEKFTLEKLHKQIAQIFTKVILECKKNGKKEKGFDILWNLKKEIPALYNLVCGDLEKHNHDFYNDYFITKFLPFEIANLDEAEEYLINNRENFSDDSYQAFLKYIRNIIDKEMEEATNFIELLGVVKRVSEIRDKFSELNNSEKELKDIFDYSCYKLWNNFNMKWFQISDLDNYKFCQVQDMHKWCEEKSCPNAKKVKWLLSMSEGVLLSSDIKMLNEFVFTDDKFNDKEFKNNVLKDLKKRFNNDIKGKINASDIDASLLLNYDIKKEQFALVNWINEMAKNKEIEIHGSLMEEFVQDSSLLQEEEIKKIIIESIESTIKHKKKSKYNILNSNGKKALNELQNYLSDEVNCNKNTRQLFNYTLHRCITGCFALFTFINCNLSLWRYGSKGNYIPLVFVVVFITSLFILVTSLLCKGGNSILLDNLGIKNVVNVLIYIYVVIGFLLMTIVVWHIDNFLIKAICSMIFLDIAVASVFLYGITLRE